MDELRIGTDWGAVTTPEPGTTSLMLVASIVMPLLMRSRIGD
jgi:hypothetical protein